MSYYGAGDYYGAGGIGSFLKKAAGAVVGGGIALLTGGPVAAARTAVSSFAGPRPGGGGLGPLINPPFGGAPGAGIGAFGTPAHMATRLDPRYFTKDGRPRRIRKDGLPWKRPTMDPANPRAIRRAIRRANRFVGIARGALANTKWKVASRSSGTRRRK